MQENKNAVRQKLLKQREGISKEKFEAKSEQITNHLSQLFILKEAQTVHCYVSMNERREVNTHPFIKRMVQSDKQVVVPTTNFEGGTLRHVHLKRFDQLASNKWGVLEPENGSKVSPDELDIVVVPMVAADEQCNRIGYGKGFYDRFLQDISAPAVGLIFEQNIINELPVEDFDVPLDGIISEKRTIRNSRSVKF